MGATYTRQSTYADGDTINADDTNDEFDQLLAAFAASSGHTHDGTTAEGGPVTKLLGNTLTFGAATAGTDITITFDGESNDGVFKWMEDEDYFEFSDDILIASTEKIQFRDTAIYINSSADGQLDLVADTEIQIAATTIDINGAVDVSGTLAVAGVLTGASLDISGDIDIDGTTNLDVVDIDGAVDMATTALVTGVLTTTATQVATGGITSGSDIVSDTDSTDDLGTTSVRWANLFVDGITATDQITATGFTGTLDGILGSGSAAAATVTTLDTSGAVNLNLTTDSTSSTSGALIVDGGVGVAKKLFVGTDLDVDGTTNLDIVDIDGAVNIAADTTIASTNKIIFNDASQFIHAPSTTVLDLAATDEIELTATLVDVVGNFTNSGTIVSAGVVTANAGVVVDEMTLDADTLTATDDFIIDAAANIEINADGGTITFKDASASLGTITSSGYSGTAAVATTVTITDNESTNENNAIIFTAGGDLDGGNLGLESDGDLKYNPSTGTLSATNISVSGTLSTVDSVTMSANNAVVFEGATADAHETTLTIVDATADRTITLPNVSGTVPVLAAASNTQVTSTPEELNILDGATVVVGEINALDIGSTAVGTAVASKAVILDSNKDYTGVRNLTITGELDAATLDISGDIDVDGTTNLDIVDVDGAANFAADVTFADGADMITASAGTSNFRAGVNAGNSIESGGNFNVVVGDESGTAITTGDNNVGLGYASLAATTTGTSNTGIGFSALDANTTANDNTGVGANSLGANTTGTRNTSVGSDSLDANTEGNDNTAVGKGALGANTTASNNTAVGKNALAANIVGAGNTAVGSGALLVNTASNNLAVGLSALEANTSGTTNTAVGRLALYSNTTASNNVAVGNSSMQVTTTGANNTAVGTSALAANTEGTENTAVGYGALDATTTGSYNVGVGVNSMGTNTTGTQNAAFGRDSLNANTTGASNVAIGNHALHANTTGSNNVAVGYTALDANTTAANNTAMGHSALGANTTGAQNTAVGTSAGAAITTAVNSVLMGYQAGDAITTGNNNVAIGTTAGTAMTTGSGSTFVGHGAGTATIDGVNNVGIGLNALGADCVGENVAVGNNSLLACTASNNTSVGSGAGRAVTSGSQNVFVGTNAGDAIIGGANNVAIGFNALSSQTSANGNTAVGQSSLLALTTGTTTTGFGENAGLVLTTGAHQTLIGHQAGYRITTGTHNTCLGKDSGGNITTGGENITIGRTAGQDAVADITTASNQIVLGINAHTHAFIKIDWTVTSDERDKMNFGEVPHGLSFVNDLQPVKFDFKKSRDDATPHGQTKYGFKAQDILALEGDNPIIINNEDEDNLKVTNSHLIPVLVKALQELSAKNDALEARLTTLEG